MIQIRDDQLANWTKPWFGNEEERADQTGEVVRNAINSHPILSRISRVYPKGSYPNNTNVRHDSDIDIAVELTDMVRLEYAAPSINFAHTGLYPYEGIDPLEFKNLVGRVLIAEFGANQVIRNGNKIFQIRGSDKIQSADIVPCTTHHFYYSTSGDHIPGIQLILDKPDGKIHDNYPEQHLKNGIDKNNATGRRYKSVVRILKNLKNHLVENDGIPDYHSYMIESIAFNVDNATYLKKDNWREIIKDICIEAYGYLSSAEPAENRWFEVNRIKYLFHPHQKWTRKDAEDFIIWIFMAIK